MPDSPGGTSAKKRKKLALGRGLDALIPQLSRNEDENRENEALPNYLECDIALLQPNRYQPRTHFDSEELADLSESIRSQGILQPLLVRRLDMGYELVAGERRLRAAKLAGLDKVPIVVKEVSDSEMVEMSIVENIQRENLNPMEEADAYRRLIDEFGLTQEQAAARVGKSRSAVANFLRLRQLPEPIKTSIREGHLSMGHARALLGVELPAQQTAVWQAVVRKSLSVRQTEELVKQLRRVAPVPAPKPASSEERHLSSVAESLSRRFGTKVRIRRRGKKGKLEIEFYNDADLNRLLELLG
jgi:ParB family chromosome partitioning protein